MPTAGQYYPPETEDATAEGAIAAMKLLLDIDAKVTAEEKAREEKFREAARILAENKKEMAGMNCGIVEDGDSERKKAAIKKLLEQHGRSN